MFEFSSIPGRRFSARKIPRASSTLYILWLLTLFTVLSYIVSHGSSPPHLLQVQALNAAELENLARSGENVKQQRQRVLEEARKMKEDAKFKKILKGGAGPDGKILKSDAAKKISEANSAKKKGEISYGPTGRKMPPLKVPISVKREANAKAKEKKEARMSSRRLSDLPSNDSGNNEARRIVLEKTCFNNVKEDHETDLNCGGPCSDIMMIKNTLQFPAKCSKGKKCSSDSDCIGQECDMSSRTCKARSAFYSCDDKQLLRDMNEAYFGIASTLQDGILRATNLLDYVQRSMNPDGEPVPANTQDKLTAEVERFKIQEGTTTDSIKLFWGYLSTEKWFKFIKETKENVSI